VIRKTNQANGIFHLIETDLSAIVEEALIRLKILVELYKNGNIEERDYVIGSIYPKKCQFLKFQVEPLK